LPTIEYFHPPLIADTRFEMANSSVYPSPSAFATVVAAVTPLLPGMLSTITDFPNLPAAY
jgi:hypothetical protein